MTNIDPETGIRYGYIRADSLDPDLVHELMYVHGTDLSLRLAVDQLVSDTERRADVIEEQVHDGLIEVDYHITSDPEYERILEDRIESGYKALGYNDRDDFVRCAVERETEDLCIEEPIIEGRYQDTFYRTSWLGGALNFWIFKSPVAGTYQLCSPCVPGAGNLDCPDIDGVLTYDVLPDWRVGS